MRTRKQEGNKELLMWHWERLQSLLHFLLLYVLPQYFCTLFSRAENANESRSHKRVTVLHAGCFPPHHAKSTMNEPDRHDDDNGRTCVSSCV